MIEKKFIEAKKQEFEMKEFIKGELGKGKISNVKIERTPVGEKIVLFTAKPGIVIGRGGAVIQKINKLIKKRFKLENPQIEIFEIKDPTSNAQIIADSLASSLERFGPLSFKLIAYRELENIHRSGALGAEIRLNGKLPSERSRSWRFAFGYLKKTGATSGIMKKAKAKAFTRPGVIGVNVSIVPRGTKIPDKIEINKETIESEIKERISEEEKKEKQLKEKTKGKKVKKIKIKEEK